MFADTFSSRKNYSLSQHQPSPTPVRPATTEDAVAIARVHVDSWRTTYHGLISEEYLRNLSYEGQTARWTRTLKQQNPLDAVYVALDCDQHIVGFAYGGRERTGSKVYRGELYAIYLLASAQRSGLGRQLLLAIARHLVQQGISSMLVWVLATNSARDFYQAMGGKYVRIKMEAIGGEMLKEQAYAWKDLSTLPL